MNKEIITLTQQINTDTYCDYDSLLMHSISESLINLGFRVKLKGYVYTKESIFLYIQKDFINKITTDIYFEIAQKYNVTTSSVEHSIKKSIEDTWYREMPDNDHEIFNCSSIKTDFHPTNLEFIATMAELIKLKVRKENLYYSRHLHFS